jgi:hypothetical protein
MFPRKIYYTVKDWRDKMNNYPSRKIVEARRAKYKKGARVELVSTGDPYTALIPGDRGFVEFVDDVGTVFVRRGNGSGLGVAYGEDAIRLVPFESDTVTEQIAAMRDGGKTDMLDTNAVRKSALQRGFHELADFIESNREAYARFILTGETENE